MTQEKLDLVYMFKAIRDISSNIRDNLQRPEHEEHYLNWVYKALYYGASNYETAYLACYVESSFVRTFTNALDDFDNLPALARWQRNHGIIDRAILKKAENHVPGIIKDIKAYIEDGKAGPDSAALLYSQIYDKISNNAPLSFRSNLGTQCFKNNMFSWIEEFNAYDFHRMLKLYAYDDQLFENCQEKMNYLIGMSFLRKDTSLSVGNKIVKEGQSKGVIPPSFDLYDKVEDLLNNLSWVKVYDTKVMRTLIRKKWTADELQREGISVDMLMDNLASEQENKKRPKQTKAHFIELSSKFSGAMSPEMRFRCDKIAENILSTSKHPLAKNHDLIISEAQKVIDSETATAEGKMAAQLHIYSIKEGTENKELDRFGLDDKAIRKVVSKVMGLVNTQDSLRAENDVYFLLAVGNQDKTVRQKKISRHLLSIDLGI